MTAIADADLITLGPGSLFTSVIPNLLVDGITAAIRRSPAREGVLRKPDVAAGRNHEFQRVGSHARHPPARGGKLLDYAVVNIRPIASALKKRYARQEALPVDNDVDELFKMGLKVVAGNLVARTDRIRHDPAATAAMVVKLAQEGRRRRTAAAQTA